LLAAGADGEQRMGRDSFSITRTRKFLRAPWYISIIYIADFSSICKLILISPSVNPFVYIVTAFLHRYIQVKFVNQCPHYLLQRSAVSDLRPVIVVQVLSLL